MKKFELFILLLSVILFTKCKKEHQEELPYIQDVYKFTLNYAGTGTGCCGWIIYSIIDSASSNSITYYCDSIPNQILAKPLDYYTGRFIVSTETVTCSDCFADPVPGKSTTLTLKKIKILDFKKK